MMRSLFLSAVCLAGVLLWAAPVFVNCQSDLASDAELAALAEYDFTADINGQILVDRRHASDDVDALIGPLAMGAKSKHVKDEIILGVKMVGRMEKHWWTLGSVQTLIAMYIMQNGVLPENATDLFPELTTAEGYASFVATYPTDRIMKYGVCINMATNRFYTDLTDPNWRPGGIYLEMLEPVGDGLTNQYKYGDQVMSFGLPGEPELSRGAFHITYFSAAQDEILFEDFTTFGFDPDCGGPQT